MASKVLFVLGAGPNIGNALARRFTAEGYKVALASRSVPTGLNADGHLTVKVDLNQPDQVAPAFEEVKRQLGTPSVVVYNPSNMVAVNDDPAAVTTADVAKALNIATLSFHAAVQSAIQQHQARSEQPLTCIFTGNFLNTRPVPRLMTLGIGKTASAHLIQCLSEAYKDSDTRFYYADERKPDGDGMWKGTTGEAHATFYWSLVRDRPAEWSQTFVEGKGKTIF